MFQPGIAHRIVNDLGRAFNETLLIGILDSQDKSPPHVLQSGMRIMQFLSFLHAFLPVGLGAYLVLIFVILFTRLSGSLCSKQFFLS